LNEEIRFESAILTSQAHQRWKGSLFLYFWGRRDKTLLGVWKETRVLQRS